MWLQREQFGIVNKSEKITVAFTKCPSYDIFKEVFMLCCFYVRLYFPLASKGHHVYLITLTISVFHL